MRDPGNAIEFRKGPLSKTEIFFLLVCIIPILVKPSGKYTKNDVSNYNVTSDIYPKFTFQSETSPKSFNPISVKMWVDSTSRNYTWSLGKEERG